MVADMRAWQPWQITVFSLVAIQTNDFFKVLEQSPGQNNDFPDVFCHSPGQNIDFIQVLEQRPQFNPLKELEDEREIAADMRAWQPWQITVFSLVAIRTNDFL